MCGELAYANQAWRAWWGLGCPSRACGHGQGLWQVSGPGVVVGSRPRPPLARAPLLGLVGASGVEPRLPGLACPVGLWEHGQWGCQGTGRRT